MKLQKLSSLSSTPAAPPSEIYLLGRTKTINASPSQHGKTVLKETMIGDFKCHWKVHGNQWKHTLLSNSQSKAFTRVAKAVSVL